MKMRQWRCYSSAHAHACCRASCNLLPDVCMWAKASLSTSLLFILSSSSSCSCLLPLPPSTTLPAFIHILALFRFDVMHLFLYKTKVKEKIRKNILCKPSYGMELHSIPSVTSAAIWLVQPSGVFEILGDKFLIHCLWAQMSFMRMNKLKICLRCLNPFFGRAHSQNVLRLQGLCNSGMFWDGDGGIGLGLWAQGLIPFLGLQVKWETWWSWIKVITLKHICISTVRHAETIARGFSVRKSLTSTSETLKTLGRT